MWLVVQGILYMSFGVFSLVLAPIVPIVFVMPTVTTPTEMGLLRVLGIALMVVGYFYIQGGRNKGDSVAWFASSTTVHRFTFVPVCFILVAVLTPAIMNLCIAMAVLDPVLALGTYFVWRQEMVSNQSESTSLV